MRQIVKEDKVEQSPDDDQADKMQHSETTLPFVVCYYVVKLVSGSIITLHVMVVNMFLLEVAWVGPLDKH